MNIKEVRLKKGLDQNKAAQVLGISRRTYQKLESPDSDTNSLKYRHYYELLNNYMNETSFHTNVVIGEDLLLLTNKVTNYKKRYCFNHLLDYINEDNRGKVCILYGLRRTGKTTLLFQLLRSIDYKKAAYIKVNENNNMGDLLKDLDILKNKGINIVLIDEVTLMEDFINSAATLADIYTNLDMKIVLTGNDSLGFAFSDRDELFDRNILIHTSYISFKEFSEILDINDIDRYIEFGGTLKEENMDFNDPDYDKDEVAFRDDESTRKYIDTAISRNIQRSLKNNRFGSAFIHLKELYDANELTNVINRIIEDMNHDFVLSVVNKRFKSNDLGSSKQLLLHQKDEEIRTALYDIDEQDVLKRMKELLDIKEKDELLVGVDNKTLEQVKRYLYMLDLIKDVEIRYDDGSISSRVVFVQPGMRYAISKALIHSLLMDKTFNNLNQNKKNLIIDKIMSDVKGRMLEDIILLDTSLKKKSTQSVFKYQFISGGEYDLVIYDNLVNKCELYEIKHSKEVAFEQQTKYLRNEEMIKIVTTNYSHVDKKVVLYRGDNQVTNDINYQNIEQFLKR